MEYGSSLFLNKLIFFFVEGFKIVAVKLLWYCRLLGESIIIIIIIICLYFYICSLCELITLLVRECWFWWGSIFFILTLILKFLHNYAWLVCYDFCNFGGIAWNAISDRGLVDVSVFLLFLLGDGSSNLHEKAKQS